MHTAPHPCDEFVNKVVAYVEAHGRLARVLNMPTLAMGVTYREGTVNVTCVRDEVSECSVSSPFRASNHTVSSYPYVDDCRRYEPMAFVAAPNRQPLCAYHSTVRVRLYVRYARVRLSDGRPPANGSSDFPSLLVRLASNEDCLYEYWIDFRRPLLSSLSKTTCRTA